ncbi:MAG: hypothetical protein R3343_00650 [Nitriliruptorales bacterium]|nr:hypothetical protein [Nitriliruptorales bacterium]
MFTSLMPGAAPSRALTRRGRRTALLVASALVVGLMVTQLTAIALQEGAPPDELVDRLVELEQQLPALPPDEVLIAEDETWAEFTGDFTGAKVSIDALAEEARDLFITANESGPNPVADAVASAARSILILQEGYGLLAEWESYDLAFPVDDADDDGVATGADEPYGLAEAGLRLVLDAHSRRLAAYGILRDADGIEDTERDFFEGLYQDEVTFDTDQRPLIHRGLSLDTTAVLRAVERFGTSAPGSEARARVATYVCVPREAYTTGDLPLASLPEELVALGVTAAAADCPDLKNGNEVRLVEP